MPSNAPMPAIGRNHLEALRLDAAARRFTAKADLVKHLMKSLTVGFCVWVVMAHLVDLAKAEPGALRALTGLAKALRMDRWMLILLNCVTGAAWYLERRGKKHKTVKMGQMRAKLERSDAYRTSSGLTPQGDSARNADSGRGE